MSTMDIGWWIERKRHKLWMAFIWKLPRKVVYWCAIRLMSDYPGNPADRSCGDALKAWEIKCPGL